MYEYDIEYKGSYNDLITESFDSLREARELLKEIKEDEDCLLVRTWRYKDGKYLGDIPPRR